MRTLWKNLRTPIQLPTKWPRPGDSDTISALMKVTIKPPRPVATQYRYSQILFAHGPTPLAPNATL
jgi:hypothetical protein